MYSKDKLHVCLVDFQFVRYDSCAKDLFYFACMNDVGDFEECKFQYQQYLSKYLSKIPFSLNFSLFDQELKIIALKAYQLVCKVLNTTLQGREYNRQKRIAEKVFYYCCERKNGEENYDISRSIR